MRGATLYINDMLEEREREQRRRTRKAFAGAIAIALLGLGAAMRQPKAPPPTVVKTTVDRPVPVEIECSVMRAVEVEKEKPVSVQAATPPSIPLLPLRGHGIELVDPTAAPTRHLCVTPKRLLRFSGYASDHVTVSNIGETSIRITQIETIPKRSSFFVNASDCDNRTLQARDRCTIVIALLEPYGETMDLRIANDAGEEETIRVVAPTAAASPASRDAAY
jgi:hypothetical protein